MMDPQPLCIAFIGDRCLAEGDLRTVAAAARRADARPGELAVFDATTSQPIDLDLRGSVDDVLSRLPAPAASPAPGPRGPGRPKLGVVAREVTLLPRHWDWLAQQPGGASVALRKLIDDARRANIDLDTTRSAQEAAYRFASAMAGDRPHYEEAMRALFAADRPRFIAMIAEWPADIRRHLERLAGPVFDHAPPPPR